MDALALLTADHNRVRGLFTRFREAHESEDTAAMNTLAELIFTELEVHTTIEEQIFYPTIHELSDDIAETVDEGVEEHHVAKVLMDELRGIGVATDEWTAKMTVLIENVEHHAEEEESELFPEVRSTTDAAVREELGGRLEAKKAELGAPTLDDKIGMTKEDLDALAREQAIPGRSTMSKEELAATVAPA